MKKLNIKFNNRKKYEKIKKKIQNLIKIINKFQKKKI